jgi:predicted HAD superfamily hydrolase
MLDMKSRLERKIDRARVISFDVFDTAILRKLDEPRSLFDLMLPHVSACLGSKTTDFPAARFTAEGEARRRAWANGNVSEVTFSEIYAIVAEILDLDAAAISELCRREIEAEMAVCLRDPFIYSVYRRSLDLGKSVVFLSDMYLPQATVSEILKNCGYTKYDALLVSSETRRTKASGALYGEALERVGIAPKQWLHIGDNPHSDIRMARKRGIPSWHYASPAEKFKRDRRQFDAWRADRPCSPAGYVVKGLVTNRLAAANPLEVNSGSAGRFWEDFGYSAAGPLYAGFTEWLIEQATKRDLQAIYFLARDGYAIKRLFEMFRPPGLADIETHYLYASRRALNFASIRSLDDAALKFLTQSYGLNTIGAFLQRIGLEPQAFADDIRRVGFKDVGQRVRTSTDFERLEQLLKSLSDPILQRARSENAVMRDYLVKSGLADDRRIALVDIGWQGSQQQAIQAFLRENGCQVRPTGLYLGTFWFASNLYGLELPNHAYLFNRGQPREYEGLVLSCVEIFELLFSSPEGSLVRMERRSSGEFAPIRQPVDAEDASRNEIVQRLQAGAMQFAADYFALKQAFPDLTIDSELALTQVRRVLRHPTPLEARSLGDIAHTKDFGESTRGPIARRSSLFGLLRRRSLIRRQEGTWRAGIEARSSWVYRALYRLRMGDLA